MTEIITYRLSATGIWEYEFYDSYRNPVGVTVSATAPSAPVRIEGGDLKWYSRFDIDTTIVPGTGRRVKDDRSGEEIYRLIYWRPGLYEVRAGQESIQVEIREGTYLFGKPLMPVTAMTERISEAAWRPQRKNANVEPCFCTTVFEKVSAPYLLMVLSFPALRMY